MTPEEKDKWIALIEGVADGGQLQVRTSGDGWTDAHHLVLDVRTPDSYRIKPREPRRVERFVDSSVMNETSPICIDKLYIRDDTGRVRVRITEIL
jgi:hypothetical protein